MFPLVGAVPVTMYVPPAIAAGSTAQGGLAPAASELHHIAPRRAHAERTLEIRAIAASNIVISVLVDRFDRARSRSVPAPASGAPR
jgi:hypothetical protein